jgi:hypothetical protein
LDLNGSLLIQEVAGDFGKILHVGAEDHRFAERAGLDRILASFSGEAFADENDVGMFVKILQLAGRVDQQTIDLAGTQAGLAGDFVAIEKFDLFSRQFAGDFAAALKMPRYQDQEQVGEFGTQTQELVGQQRFFTRMRATA